MTTLAEVSRMTDIDRVTKMIAEAANKMRSLEAQAEAIFRQWVEAQMAADDAGLSADLKMSGGMAAALSEFKQRISHAESREIAREELNL
jgi:hypothetical protein